MLKTEHLLVLQLASNVRQHRQGVVQQSAPSLVVRSGGLTGTAAPSADTLDRKYSLCIGPVSHQGPTLAKQSHTDYVPCGAFRGVVFV